MKMVNITEISDSDDEVTYRGDGKALGSTTKFNKKYGVMHPALYHQNIFFPD